MATQHPSTALHLCLIYLRSSYEGLFDSRNRAELKGIVYVKLGEQESMRTVSLASVRKPRPFLIHSRCRIPYPGDCLVFKTTGALLNSFEAGIRQ